MITIRLNFDELTFKVFGYELVSNMTELYKNDVILQITSDQYRMLQDNMGKVYYNPAEKDFYVPEELDSYSKEIEDRKSELLELQTFLKDPTSAILDMAADEDMSYEEALQTLINMKKAAASLQEELDEIVNQHNLEIFKYSVEQHNLKEAGRIWKYYSSVCMLIRDENRYLQEWIEWYINLGVDHIYIYDNGVKQNVTDVINDLSIEIQDKVTVIEFKDSYRDVQEDSYNHWLVHYGDESRWVNFLDSDEFVRITNEKYANINELLRDYEDYTTIFGNILEYNAGGAVEATDEPVRERFTETTYVNDGVYHKDWIQPFRIDRMYIHYPRYSQRGNYEFRNEVNNEDLFIVDHYYTKSWEEWCVKINRGSATPLLLKSKNEFFLYNPDMKFLKGEEQTQGYNA